MNKVGKTFKLEHIEVPSWRDLVTKMALLNNFEGWIFFMLSTVKIEFTHEQIELGTPSFSKRMCQLFLNGWNFQLTFWWLLKPDFNNNLL